MKTLFTFILGVLSGWLIEWLIDYFHSRRQLEENGMEPSRAARAEVKMPLPPKTEPDNLKIIKGIGVVIEGKLNQAGIFTFEQLGKLNADELRQILGKTIQRLANEDSLLQQARELAHSH